MSTLWMPRPSNAGTLPCRNNQNCYYLKNGHCWYYHPPQHHAQNQQARTNTNSTSTDSNPFSQQWNSGGNIFNTARSNGRNQSNTRNRGSNRNNRRRRNQRLNQVTDGGSGNSFPTSPLQRRNAPTIQSPQTKRTREDISDTISPSANQQSDEKEINIEAFQCPISMEVGVQNLTQWRNIGGLAVMSPLGSALPGS